MLLAIPDVLSKDQVTQIRGIIDAAEWGDGKVTAGYQSGLVKENKQLAESSSAARQAGEVVLTALGKTPLFMSAALPLKVFPPLFNKYEGGGQFGTHVDNAIRQITGTPHKVRTDISATLFLSEPASYDGGELVVEDVYGPHNVKLPAGHMVLYPGTSLHQVRPVTRGARVASFFWIESMVRDDAQRTLLFDIDMSIQRLIQELGPGHAQVVSLTGSYHNLVRMWAST
jgi:PKHD-type hydroxylase